MKVQRGWKAAIASRRKLLTEPFRTSSTAIWTTSSCPILKTWRVTKKIPRPTSVQLRRASPITSKKHFRKFRRTNICYRSSASCMAWRRPRNLSSRWELRLASLKKNPAVLLNWPTKSSWNISARRRSWEKKHWPQPDLPHVR